MKRRRQHADTESGDPFLDALAAGQDDPAEGPAATSASTGAGDSAAEQRARVAEGALRQLRTDSERRLQAAREAIQRERELRLAAEAEAARLRRSLAPQGLHEASAPPVFSRDDVEAPTALPPAAAAGATAWPSPWLGEQGKS